MARGQKGVPFSGQEPQEEMTVMFVRLKGSSSSLQKGFEAFRTAFESSAQAGEPPRRVPTVEQKQLANDGMHAIDEDGDEHEDNGDVIDGDLNGPIANQKPSAPRKPPKFMPDFDLAGKDTSWKEFATKYDPQTDNDKYLVAALWLTEHGNTTEFTIGHVFTCFRAAQWKEASDFSQPMRGMKSKSSYYSTPTRKTWKLTQPGLDAARAVIGGSK